MKDRAAGMLPLQYHRYCAGCRKYLSVGTFLLRFLVLLLSALWFIVIFIYDLLSVIDILSTFLK